MPFTPSPTAAPLRSGVTTVLVPARNKSDLVDLPDEVLRLLDIKQVDTIDEVLELALLAPDERGRQSGGVRVSAIRPDLPPGART